MVRDTNRTDDVDDAKIRTRAAETTEFPELADLTTEVLRDVTTREGVDFATALLYDRVVRSPRHASWIERIDSLRKRGAQAGESDGRAVLVAVVPAAFYKEKPQAGADGRVVRATAKRLGLRCELVPLESTGTLGTNAEILRRWLASRPEKKIVLASLCKGGADVKHALARPDAEACFRNVHAWVNVCGTLNGSPVALWMLASKARFFAAWLFFKCNGHDFRFLREIAPSSDGPLSAPLRLPKGMRFVSVVGFPLRRHLTNGFMRRCHRLISAHGPNDGGVLLAEACRLPGEIYPVWGADHYLRPDERAEEILAAILTDLVDERGASARDSA